MGVMERLVYLRRHPLFGRIARELLLVYGVDIPAAVTVGNDLHLQHRGLGTVIHPATRIGTNVTIYHQVTVGRADAHIPIAQSPFEAIELEDDVILYPGAKILGGHGITTIGNGAIIAANAVVTGSVPPGEVWAGAPARRINSRNLALRP
jgi:serine O-acetyltransferase